MKLVANEFFSIRKFNDFCNKNNISEFYLYIYILHIGLKIDPGYMVMFLIIAIFFLKPKKQALKISTQFALIIFILTYTISTTLSDNTDISLIKSKMFIPALMIYIIVINVEFSLNFLKRIFVVFSITNILICCNFIYVAIFFEGHPIEWMQKVGLSNFSVPNDLLLVALTFPFSYAIFILKENTIFSLISITSIILSILSIILYESNISILCVIISMYAFNLKIMKNNSAIIFAIVLLVTVDYFNNFFLSKKFLQLSVWGNRVPVWIAAWKMFLDAPFFGHGPGIYGLFSESIIEQLTVPEWIKKDTRHTPWAHSLYLEALCERGMFGLLALMILMLQTSRRLILLYQNAIQDEKIIIFALLISFICFVFSGIFEISLLRHWVLIYLSVTLGLLYIILDIKLYAHSPCRKVLSTA